MFYIQCSRGVLQDSHSVVPSFPVACSPFCLFPFRLPVSLGLCATSLCDFSLAPFRRAPSGLSSGLSTSDDYCLSSSDDRSLSFLAPLAPHSVCVAGEVVVWTGLYLLAAPGLSSPGALVLSAASVRSPLHPTPLSLFTSTLHPCPCCPKPHSLAPCHCGRLHSTYAHARNLERGVTGQADFKD